MNKLVIMLCAISLAGCALAWDGGYKVIPEETDETMITYKFDPVIADMKKMKRDANAYCKGLGFRKADQAAIQPSFSGIYQLVYECEP